jgi:hypothetical protein
MVGLTAPLSTSIYSNHVQPLSSTSPPFSTHAWRSTLISRRQVEHLIALGQLIVIYDGQILKLDSWVEKHPGGRLPLLHMVGVDASCEVAA